MPVYPGALPGTGNSYAPEDGPDGLTCDAEGNIYAAVRNEKRFGISVYSPEGKELSYLATPERPTNVGFGRGTEATTLYITAAVACIASRP